MEKIEGRFNVLMMAALLLLPVQTGLVKAGQPPEAEEEPDEVDIAVSNTQASPFMLNITEINLVVDVPSGAAFDDEMLILGKLVSPVFAGDPLEINFGS